MVVIHPEESATGRFFFPPAVPMCSIYQSVWSKNAVLEVEYNPKYYKTFYGTSWDPIHDLIG